MIHPFVFIVALLLLAEEFATLARPRYLDAGVFLSTVVIMCAETVFLLAGLGVHP